MYDKSHKEQFSNLLLVVDRIIINIYKEICKT